MVPWLNWIEQPPPKGQVTGSRSCRDRQKQNDINEKKKIIIDKKIICGIDEAGRGSWAGPVVSAAVILKNYPNLNHLNDSKILTSKKEKKSSKN